MFTNLTAKARKLAGILAVPAWRAALLRHRVAAGVEHARVLRNLGPARTVVDIGANRGQFALAVRHCFPDAAIVSFEPLPGPAAGYRAVFAGDGRARLVEAAIGPESGTATIHLSARDDSSSLLPITAQQNELFPGTAEAGTATIRVLRLADALPAADIAAPALLKLDVQGFELQALAGCEEVLERFAWVYAECSFQELYAGQAFADEVIAWLRERGLRLAGVYHMAYDERGRAVQADFLFGR
ncbi:MAG: FkbM family methyltransferase [Porticoccaceae bacterium]